MRETNETLYRTKFITSLANSCADEKVEEISGYFNVRVLKKEHNEFYVEVVGGHLDGKRFLIPECQLKLTGSE